MEESKRYLRQVVLSEVGTKGQQKLKNAKVLVIGAGGLGCPVLQILASSGVGTLGIVDGDTVDISNLHRQLLYNIDDCGKNKADVAARAIQKINSEIDTKVYSEFVSESNISSITKDYEILVDCTDVLAVRYLINDIAVFTNKPMVYASIHKFQGQISVFNYKNGPTYRCLFPEKKDQKIPNCQTTGVLGVLPNVLGMLQATEVLKMILQIGEVLSGKLLIYNMLKLSFHELNFNCNEEQISIGATKGAQLKDLKKTCYDVRQEAFFSFISDINYTLIDLREKQELPTLKGNNIVNISFFKIKEYLNQFDKDQQIILFCQSGIRSQKALEMFLEKGFSNVSHLKRGVQNLQILDVKK